MRPHSGDFLLSGNNPTERPTPNSGEGERRKERKMFSRSPLSASAVYTRRKGRGRSERKCVQSLKW